MDNHNTNLKTAIVHDWIVTLGGAENCLKDIYKLYPSDVYTLVSKKESAEALGIDYSRVHNSFIQKFIKAQSKYRTYLPFFPLAIEQFDLSSYDVIISSSHAAAKGVLTTANQLHICYCYSPMRYAWDLYHQYLKEANLTKGIKGKIAKLILHYMRVWDYTTANRVDHFIGISDYICKRIKRIYGREATTIYPPVDTDEFILHENKENIYLTASRMVPYKRIDLVAETFSKLPDKKLVIIGDGPDFEKVKDKAKGCSNIEILGYQPFNVLKEYMQKSKAFIFPPEEDFGIIPIEAMACGTPVIAFGKGGACETIVENKTGIFFKEQTVESLKNAIIDFEKIEDKFIFNEVRKHAEKFNRERYKQEMKNFINNKITDHSS